MPQQTKSDGNKYRYRFTASVDDEMYENVNYWAKKRGISINELLRDAIELYISHANKDYDLPTCEIQRLNQLVDSIGVLSSNIQSLENVTVSSLNTLIELTRGSNYLLDDTDGDINTDE